MSPQTINFIDLAGEYQRIKKEINSAVSRVFQSGRFILGEEVASFEKEFASFVGRKYAVGLASGTDTLTIAVKCLGLKDSDEVLLPANVYPTVFGVALSGVKVRLCDVEPQSLNLSLNEVKRAVTAKTKAIVVVHLYGNPADIEPIRKIAHEKGIYLIEDCAQAAGSLYLGKKVGCFGDVACFSFYPTKNLGAYGDGGALLTDNQKIYHNALLWRMYGEEERYRSVLVGLNSRLDELQAAILRVKLRYVEQWNRLRHRVAEKYRELLQDLPLEMIEENKKGVSGYHLFVIKVKERDKLAESLKKAGIPTAVHYPIPIHLTPSFSSLLEYRQGDFPVSEKASQTVLSLPMHPYLKLPDVEYIASVIRMFFTRKKR